jgi:hypothetical protein
MHESIKVDSPIEILDITPLNPLISKCQIKVCYVGDEPNRNGSVISKAVATEMAKTLGGSPIVGFYNENTEDFEAHNQIIDISNGEWKFKDTTQPYGFVPLNAKVWFQKFMDEGVEHEYLMTEGYLWTGQYPETQRILSKGNNQSMELYEPTLKGFWSESDNGEPSFFIINEAIISKLCILGEDVEPCFEGAQITKVQFSFEPDFQQKLFEMMEQVKEIEGKGGADSVEEVKTPEMEEEVLEEEKLEEEVPAEPEVEETPEQAEEELPEEEEEPQEEEDKEVKYNLDEVQEYIELKSNYEALQTQFNEMKAKYDELVEFKLEADRKEKQTMIDSFYMLTEEDKKDVIENIDKYSIDDIEAKLSVICVRNKVSFDLEKDKEEEVQTTFNLESDSMDDDLVPAWIKAAMATKKEME